MGDIPGLGYTPPVPIDREAIPGHDAHPEVRRRAEDGQDHLWWGTRELPPEPDEDLEEAWAPLGAPAMEHLREALERGRAVRGPERPGRLIWPTVDPSELLSLLWEALELPGTAKDYHSALQRVRGQLNRARHGDAEVLESIERLAWLDVRLMLAYPDVALSPDRDGVPRYHWRGNSFDSLRELYVQEGFLRDAFGVTDPEAQNFGHAVHPEAAKQGHGPSARRDDLRSRLEAIRDESVS